MGNTVLPRMCRHREAGTALADAVTGVRRPENLIITKASAPAAPRKQRDDVELGDSARPGRRRGGGVPLPAPGGGCSDGAAACTVVTVKIVMKRKDAEALVTRLNAQGAREREARMAELKRELRAGDASPASCRDVWRPRLAPIQES